MSDGFLLALSPLDGRYAGQTRVLVPYFSEMALIRYRVRIEVEYLIRLSALNLKNCPALPEESGEMLRSWAEGLATEDGKRVKELESVLNHDVKAVEYLVKEKLEASGLGRYVEFVHFGLTSQDINNTAIPLALEDCSREVLMPALLRLRDWLDETGERFRAMPMLARTHGQPASPTRFGKELLVFRERLDRQMSLLSSLTQTAKFGGATGNFNAHYVAYPDVDWPVFADELVAALGLVRPAYTTQIDSYDTLAAWCDGLARIQTILIDLCRDFWQYISMDYLRQKVVAGEVGSSAMPHKVNPIDFENAEGNLGLSNALLHHFSSKLPVSRLQRDLTDSTVLRNLGVPLGHSLVAFNGLLRGFGKVEVNEAGMLADLQRHPEVLAEAIQTILRREGYPRPYEALKDLTRHGQAPDLETIRRFVENLPVAPSVKAEMLQLTPETYIGVLPGKSR